MRQLLLRGTLLLTIAGILSRIMGFFYRIFLANTIGAEGLGIYQMIFPIYSVCFSLCASGIETATSKLVAAKYALKKEQDAFGILKTALFLTITLALCCSFSICITNFRNILKRASLCYPFKNTCNHHSFWYDPVLYLRLLLWHP